MRLSKSQHHAEPPAPRASHNSAPRQVLAALPADPVKIGQVSHGDHGGEGNR